MVLLPWLETQICVPTTVMPLGVDRPLPASGLSAWVPSCLKREMVLVALFATQTCEPTCAMPLGVLRLLPDTAGRATGVPPDAGVLVAVATARGVLVGVEVDGTGVLVGVGDVVDSCQREMVLVPALTTQTWLLPTAARPWGWLSPLPVSGLPAEVPSALNSETELALLLGTQTCP